MSKALKVHIATAQTPFRRNPTDALAADLRDALRRAGHRAETVQIPYGAHSSKRALDHLLALRLLALDESPDDVLIALEYPTYLIRHPRKVLWLARGASQPDGLPGAGERTMDAPSAAVRQEVEGRACREARAVYSISAALAHRWRKLTGLEALPLYPPPWPSGCADSGTPDDYVLAPLGGDGSARVELLLKALARARRPVVVRFLGDPGDAELRRTLARQAETLGLGGRWQWSDRGPEEAATYARCRAVLAAPYEETNPETALLAMQAGKALIVGRDSGALAELVVHRRTGWVVAAKPKALARAMDKAWSREDKSRVLGQAARASYLAMNLDWEKVLELLLA